MSNKAETEYNQNQYNHNYPDGMENHYWNLHRNKFILKTIKKFKLNNILDVGCGRGIVSIFLKEKGLTIEGVELGNSKLIRESTLKVKYGTDALKIPKEETEKYETISLYDVLEHIEKPKDFINDISNHFNKVSNLIITVPARQELWTNFDDYFGHFRRYNLKTIENEFENTDFEIKFKGYFFHILYFLIRINNFFFKNRKIAFSVPNGVSKLLHFIVSKFFILDTILFPSSFVGSSIIIIANRKK